MIGIMIKSQEIQNYRLFYTIVGIFSFLLLIFITAINRVPPFWDELYYLNNVILLQEYGLTKEFLVNYKGPAGPTFAIIHYLANSLTHLSAPWVRLISVLFLGTTLLLIFLCFKKLGKSKINSIAFAFSTMAIPTIYTISGMALTEIPAIFFFTIALYFITSHFISNTNNYFHAIITGLSLSFAILGRQPLIMIIMAFPILFIDPKNFFRLNFKNYNFLKFLVVTLLISIIIPSIVFGVWGNIQPKSTAFTGLGLVPNNFILALGYSCIFTLLVNPNFFKWNNFITNKNETLVVIIFAIFLNIFILKVEFMPFKTLVFSTIPPNWYEIYRIISGNILSVLGLSFLYFFMKTQYLKKDKLLLFFSISFILVVATSLKVTHQFSARYVGQAFPLLVLAINMDRTRFNIFSIVTLMIGCILGYITLESYFK
jgi:hypothetical protein